MQDGQNVPLLLSPSPSVNHARFFWFFFDEQTVGRTLAGSGQSVKR